MESRRNETPPGLEKTLTGIKGLDEITCGGLPAGRATLVCGGAGCGKTLLGMQFLVNGAQDYNEPGVIMAFEESRTDLAENMSSLGVDIERLVADKQLRVDHVNLDHGEIIDAGDFDLDGLFVRLGHAIDSIGARRVVLDTVETLFGTLPNAFTLRRELRRLFEWLKHKGVTTIITGERGDETLTRHGIEEYVHDCVITLDHRVDERISTRRLRVMKYRGSTHGTNEYPFFIDARGINVLPITSIGLDHVVGTERISSGVPQIDEMLGGSGYYRGSSILVSGTSGCGKTSLSAHFVNAACERGERCMMFLFEEAPSQLMRNMNSIGIDLAPWVKNGSLRFEAMRPTLHGLEVHLADMQRHIEEFSPDVVVIDPISTFEAIGTDLEIRAMLTRMVDYLKMRGVTVQFTSLSHDGEPLESSGQAISSLIDTWLLLRDIESSGERNHGLYILKSRGMAHSNQIREFLLTDEGIDLLDVYVGPAGVLTGSARRAQEAREEADVMSARQEIGSKRSALERKRLALKARIAALEAEFVADETDVQRLIRQEEEREQRLLDGRTEMRLKRGG